MFRYETQIYQNFTQNVSLTSLGFLQAAPRSYIFSVIFNQIAFFVGNLLNLKMSYSETMIGFLIVEDILSATGITEDQRVLET